MTPTPPGTRSAVLNFLERTARFPLGLAGVKSMSVQLGEHKVHYYFAPGKKDATQPPLVLLHGLGGTASGFGRLMPLLARSFRAVYCPDFPGSGMSPLPKSGPLPLLDRLDVVHAFLEEVVRAPAFLVGNSLGGALSILYSARSPEKVAALGLIAPAGAEVAAEKHRALLQLFRVKGPKEAREIFGRLYHRTPPHIMWLAPTLAATFSTPGVQALVAELETQGGIPPEMMAKLAMPILLLWGASEKVLPYEGIDYFKAHFPSHAKLDVVEGFGHVPHMERPVELAERLVAFAQSLPALGQGQGLGARRALG
jgi:pimeloyl-ACP methyl ester carboxylesterase